MHDDKRMTHRPGVARRGFLGLCAGLPAVLSCISEDGRGQDGPDFTSLRSTSVVSVSELAPDQSLSARRCSIATQLGALVGPGEQLRIRRSAEEYALYTVAELRDELDPTIVRMSTSGRERLGTSETFVAELDTRVAASELSDAEAEAQSEFVERLVDDGVHADLLVVAAHGGKIEAFTDKQAEHVVGLLPGISSWICKGWRKPSGAFSRWHVTSTAVSPASFPGLTTIAGRGFAHVVSFHGMSQPGVIIGGRAPVELRESLRDAIVAAIADPEVEVSVSGSDGPLSGVASSNFVNWLSADGERGIQIEQSYAVRSQHWAAIAEAVAGVLGPL